MNALQKDANVSSTLVMMSLARLARLGQESQLAQGHGIPSSAPQAVCIRKADSAAAKPPLVLIHPIGGSIIPYRDLSSGLKSDRAIYAFQSQADEERNTLRHADIASIATDYIDQLTSLGLGSRFVLGGYSLGGAIAFEMAQRMLDRGLEIDTVIVIDTPARIRPAAECQHDRVTTGQLLMFGNILAGRLGKQLQLQDSDLESLPVGDGIQLLLDRLRELKIVQSHTGDHIYHAIYEMARHNERLQRDFEPRPYTGSLSLVRTMDEAPEFRVEAAEVYEKPAFGWQKYCSRQVSVKRVPGSHFQLLYPPFIRGLAAAVQKFLDEQSVA